ncbi:MAG: phosphoribosylglycinamide formyltransferase [Marinifilaceae bacterium]|jgi:phosphoribosylglycinamide formyltransferase-1|nr:phosphoribosylglycinamide formyltransferase [Marinifilaceae bacterium]
MINIAILASGSGSNAENIANYFKANQLVNIDCIITNNPNAYVIKRAEKLNIDFKIFNKSEMKSEDKMLKYLNERNIDFVVLAGFLLLVPKILIDKFPNKIINIHPALLPNYGGKGMYGMNVHNAVIENKERESGITIHYVNENYDEGEYISQHKCTVDKNDDAESLANKVHELEYEFFPKVLEDVFMKSIK